MSTSPSWFDQEKFSRLVKKVGPKAGPAGSPPAAPSRTAPPRPPEKETRRLQRSLETPELSPPPEEPADPPAAAALPPPPVQARTSSIPGLDGPIRATPQEPGSAGQEGEASTSNFPPPMPLPEPRSVSPLSRRTSPLPNLKPIFEYDKPADRSGALSPVAPARPQIAPPAEIPADGTEEVLPLSLEKEPAHAPNPEETAAPAFPGLEGASGDMPPGWQAFQSLSDAPARKEDTGGGAAGTELDDLRKERDELAARIEKLSQAAEERDAARNELELLRTQLQQADEIIQATGISSASLDELTRTIEERDGARRDYANLREEFENLKHDPSRSQGGSGGEQPVASSAKHDEEIAALKAHSSGLEKVVESLKRELAAVQGQIAQSRDETSVAQRGLALSQKALQETRDALREASEGFSMTKGNVESLKNECASLVQQNLALQSQNDQVSRELGSALAKLSARG